LTPPVAGALFLVALMRINEMKIDLSR
jgi:hypothetical protein